jgi:hypothetical protein
MHVVFAAYVSSLVALASPSPSPTPPLSDPCGSILSLVSRPSITTSACTVRPGHVLLENGYINTVTTGPGGGNAVAYPQSFLSVGTFDPHLEFDFTPPSVERSSADGPPTITGSSDIGVGAKYELGYSRRWVYGANVVLTIPTGTPAFSAGNAQYTGNFNWTYSVNSAIGLAGTVGFNALSAYNASDIAQSYFAFIPSVATSLTLSDGSTLNAEYVYFSRAGPNLQSNNLIDVFYVRDFGAHVQFDVEAGWYSSAQNGQSEHYAGAGLSFLY